MLKFIGYLILLSVATFLFGPIGLIAGALVILVGGKDK